MDGRVSAHEMDIAHKEYNLPGGGSHLQSPSQISLLTCGGKTYFPDRDAVKDSEELILAG
jgi:hypothetical protein